MTVECCICHEVMGEVPGPDDLVSHGMHEDCAKTFYGEDFEELLEGEPT
jgi:hypothetical protein